VVAQDLVVRLRSGRLLLNGVTLPLPNRTLVGVIGPSGAGKSTLLGVLTGSRGTSDGQVLLGNRNLHRNYDAMCHSIGLVPQENILHTQLSPRSALQYAAELRFPARTTAAERAQRVKEVLDEVDLAKHADTRGDRLSGGQLKRVSVAQELLTQPTVLYLDEPTSGLDPGLDKALMLQLRSLAHDSRTIVVVTHSVLNLDACDLLLVLAPGGRTAYFGPPDQALAHFGVADWSDLFQLFEDKPEHDWRAKFESSPLHDEHIAQPLNNHRPVDEQDDRPRRRRGWLAQTTTLTRRYVRVSLADRGYVLFMMLLPLALGGMLRFIPAPQGLAGVPGTNMQAQEILQLLITAACMTGTACSIRELVKERAIFTRERAAGLSAGAYLASKLIVLGVISIGQVAVAVLIGLTGRVLPAHGLVFTAAPLLELVVAMTMLAFATMCLGLLVSALVNTSEKAMPFLVLLPMAQMVLSGGIVSLTGMGVAEKISRLAPARWGFAAAASTVNLNALVPSAQGLNDPLWAPSAANWWRDMAMMAALAFVFATVTWMRLQAAGPFHLIPIHRIPFHRQIERAWSRRKAEGANTAR
jgi:ABC-type multidrug transport system ATPase subunit